MFAEKHTDGNKLFEKYSFLQNVILKWIERMNGILPDLHLNGSFFEKNYSETKHTFYKKTIKKLGDLYYKTFSNSNLLFQGSRLVYKMLELQGCALGLA